MSEQRSPLTSFQDALSEAQEAKHRKARRDKAAKPVAADYAPGDLIVVVAKERGGFLVHALVEVVDVLDFPPLRTWRFSFSLVVRIRAVDQSKYEPAVGHLFTVETDPDAPGGYIFGGRWVLSRQPVEAFRG